MRAEGPMARSRARSERWHDRAEALQAEYRLIHGPRIEGLESMERVLEAERKQHRLKEPA